MFFYKLTIFESYENFILKSNNTEGLNVNIVQPRPSILTSLSLAFDMQSFPYYFCFAALNYFGIHPVDTG